MADMIQADLQGLKILNPRPHHQAAKLSRLIQNAGGIAVELPTLEILALSPEWLRTVPELSTVRAAIFVSSNAVHHFFKGLASHNIAWPASIQTFAIGQGTAAQLAQIIEGAIITPEQADSEHLLALPAFQHIAGQEVLLVSGEQSRPLLSTVLTQRGANLYPIAVYSRSRPQINHKFTHSLWQDDGVDIILMLSQEAIENLFYLFEADARDWLCSKPWVVISPRLVEIARTYHVKNITLSSYHDLLKTLMGLAHEPGRNKP